jgi:hypothetical protein
MKGDRVEVLVDIGEGVQRFDILATRAGRRIEVSTSRGTVEVNEVTRTGGIVRTARFMATRVGTPANRPASAAKTTNSTSWPTGTAKAMPWLESDDTITRPNSTPITTPMSVPKTATITASARTILRI